MYLAEWLGLGRFHFFLFGNFHGFWCGAFFLSRVLFCFALVLFWFLFWLWGVLALIAWGGFPAGFEP